MRHKPCGQTVSCVCGVAIRENEIILIAEKCNDNILRTVTPNDIGTLLRGVGITQDENGRSFEVRCKLSRVYSHLGLRVDLDRYRLFQAFNYPYFPPRVGDSASGLLSKKTLYKCSERVNESIKGYRVGTQRHCRQPNVRNNKHTFENERTPTSTNT